MEWEGTPGIRFAIAGACRGADIHPCPSPRQARRSDPGSEQRSFMEGLETPSNVSSRAGEYPIDFAQGRSAPHTNACYFCCERM
jgi:hypothetical protein